MARSRTTDRIEYDINKLYLKSNMDVDTFINALIEKRPNIHNVYYLHSLKEDKYASFNVVYTNLVLSFWYKKSTNYWGCKM